MSKIKNYIDKMSDAGIDVLVVDNNIDDEYCVRMYLESLKDMNKLFSEKAKNEEKIDENV